ncbi:hypothetical protein HOLDEFILI_01809 [Holdemania filiformis DSM 12042]|uniref:Uncharacterized protein n=1 Tax=Holdemania filiformis DSM 12042 TaxID=545696 RepID=B9Y7L4_9FIRM|nr:hypothetical protein HOLDEFILI_01809 [Holdemania filiformis DSM 12042]
MILEYAVSVAEKKLEQKTRMTKIPISVIVLLILPLSFFILLIYFLIFLSESDNMIPDEHSDS